MKLIWFCILLVANMAIAKSFGEDGAGQLATDDNWFSIYMDEKDRGDVGGDSEGNLKIRIVVRYIRVQMLIWCLGKDKWLSNCHVNCLRCSFLYLGVTTKSLSEAPRFVKENTSEKGINHAEIELTQVDWPEAVISLTELGVIGGYLLNKVDHNGPSPITVENGT